MRRIKLLVTALLLTPFAANAVPITYDVFQSIGVATVTGTITTDGTLGSIVKSNITDWDLLLDDGTNSSVLNVANSFIAGSDANHGFLATATTLDFDHSVSTGTSFTDWFLFLANDGIAFWCLEGPLDDCAIQPGTSNIAINVAGFRVRYFSPVLGLNRIGDVASVPEPGTLALLGIGLFGMGLSRRRKTV